MELMIIFTTFLAVSIMVTAALNDKATVAILTFIIWFGLILIYSIQKPDSTVSLEISLPDNHSVEELDIGMTTEGRDELEGLDR